MKSITIRFVENEIYFLIRNVKNKCYITNTYGVHWYLIMKVLIFIFKNKVKTKVKLVKTKKF